MHIPASITNQSTKIIHNIFVRSIDLSRSFSDVIMFPGSDHLPLSATNCCGVKRVKKKKTETSADEKREATNVFRGSECNRQESIV